MDALVVVVAAPDSPAEVRSIPHTLEALQGIVGGYVEELPGAYSVAPGVVVLANEDGRMQGLPPNGRWPDVVGTVIVTKRNDQGDAYASLSDVEARQVVAALDGN